MSEREAALEACLRDVLNRLRGDLKRFKTLREWATHHADHASAKVRRDAERTLTALDLLGED